MILKPKATTFNPKAKLFRRYNDITVANAVYYSTSDLRFWYFDANDFAFKEITDNDEIITITANDDIISVENGVNYGYYSQVFQYNGTSWVKQTVNLPTFINSGVIGKYQTNKYYYICDFDYVVKGAIEDGKVQNIKGNILPIVSLNIKFFNDNIQLQPDDLVVIDNRLFSVENPVTDHKHMPRDYKVHFATLNSIL